MTPKDHIADGDPACRKCGALGIYEEHWMGKMTILRCTCIADQKIAEISHQLRESIAYQESETRWAAQYKHERDKLANNAEWKPITTAPTDGSRFLIYDAFEPCMEWAWINEDGELLPCSNRDHFWQTPTHWIKISPPDTTP